MPDDIEKSLKLIGIDKDRNQNIYLDMKYNQEVFEYHFIRHLLMSVMILRIGVISEDLKVGNMQRF